MTARVLDLCADDPAHFYRPDHLHDPAPLSLPHPTVVVAPTPSIPSQRKNETMNCYRVFMLDGYAALYNADTEDQACIQAIRFAIRTTLAMNGRERLASLTVDRVELLTPHVTPTRSLRNT